MITKVMQQRGWESYQKQKSSVKLPEFDPSEKPVQIVNKYEQRPVARADLGAFLESSCSVPECSTKKASLEETVKKLTERVSELEVCCHIFPSSFKPLFLNYY